MGQKIVNGDLNVIGSIKQNDAQVITTINKRSPDETGDITFKEIDAARALVSPTLDIYNSEFIFRTTGGTASLATGNVELRKILGNAALENNKLCVSKVDILLSTAMNAFDKETMVLAGYTINASGQVVENSSSYIGFVKAPGGLTDGYRILSLNNAIVRVGWCAYQPEAGRQIIISPDSTYVTEVDLKAKLSIIKFEYEGYVCFAVTDINDLCVAPQWSGYNNLNYVAYSTDSFHAPSKGFKGGIEYDLPYVAWGYELPSVGEVYEEIDLENGIYYHRIGRDSIENLGNYSEYELGVNILYDDETIYYILPYEEQYTIELGLNTYWADDFGTEEWVHSELPVRVVIAYQPNLVDKLRREVVTINEQNFSKMEKDQVIRNIGAIKSVNNQKADSNGNVAVNRVSIADNLFSMTSMESEEEFIFRTTGGSASLGTGPAKLLNIYGNATMPNNIPASADAHSEEQPRWSATVNSETFKAKIQYEGVYLINYRNGHWLLDNIEITLSEYGISVTNSPKSPVDYESIEISYIQNEVTFRILFVKRLSVLLDREVFLPKAKVEAGPYEFIYYININGWKFNDKTVDLLDYGLIYSGELLNGDMIVVNYSPEILKDIVIPKPTYFKSIGLNQFNPNNIYANRGINGRGEIVEQEGTYVGWFKASSNCPTGYVLLSTNSSLVRVGTLSRAPSYTDTGISLITGSNFSRYMTKIEVPTDIYIVFSCTDPDSVCGHPQWSGYMNEVYASYTESLSKIPTKDINGTILPLDLYGMPKVGDVADEIDLATQKYIKRIGYLEFTDANLEIVQAMGVAYMYGSNCILYVLETPVEYDIIQNSVFEAHDFGTEQFVDALAPVRAKTVYTENLTDKLRTDVLTISAQNLTEAQRIQVLKNLGIDIALGLQF